MSMEMQLFNNEEFGSVRSILIDGVPWFVGKDVAEALGYKNTRDALSRHVPDKYKKVLTAKEMASVSKSRDSQPLVDSPRGLTFINEAGLYKLVMRSELPNAEKFSDWVCDTVLPSIRKIGSYGRPLTYLEALEQLVVKEKERLALEAKNKELQVTQDLYDTVTLKNKWYSAKTVTDVLNILGLGRTNFYRFLRDQGIVTNKNQPMRKHIESGLMKARFDEWLEQYIVSFSLKGLRYIFVKLIKAKKLPENITEEIWIEYCNEMESSEEE